MTLESVFTNPNLVSKRKVITLYKQNDEALARFRFEAASMLYEITRRGALKLKLTKQQHRYVQSWACDRNPMFRDYFEALNSVLGYTFIEGL